MHRNYSAPTALMPNEMMASFAEVISLGAVVPFLGVLIDPERVVTGSLALALPIETKN